ncbi:hypothetical protein GCM10023310_34270 [Paenibacillus vulneris]
MMQHSKGLNPFETKSRHWRGFFLPKVPELREKYREMLHFDHIIYREAESAWINPH